MSEKRCDGLQAPHVPDEDPRVTDDGAASATGHLVGTGGYKEAPVRRESNAQHGVGEASHVNV